MAVIISDMEHIPNSCFDCDLHNYHFCNLTRNLVENNLDDGTRAGDCPLKEVPSGKWIERFNEDKGEVEFICSECNHTQPFGTDYCWKCGSKNVVEEQTGENT